MLVVVDGAKCSGVLSAKFLVLPGSPRLKIVATETEVSIELLAVALAPTFEKLVNLEADAGALRDKRPSAAFDQPDGNDRRGVHTGFRCKGFKQTSKPLV